jgi:hypothetical protein
VNMTEADGPWAWVFASFGVRAWAGGASERSVFMRGRGQAGSGRGAPPLGGLAPSGGFQLPLGGFSSLWGVSAPFGGFGSLWGFWLPLGVLAPFGGFLGLGLVPVRGGFPGRPADRATDGSQAAGSSVKEGHLVDALALRGDEGRGTLRKARGRCERSLIPGSPNGATHPRKRVSSSEFIGRRGEPGELKHLSSRRNGHQPRLRE